MRRRARGVHTAVTAPSVPAAPPPAVPLAMDASGTAPAAPARVASHAPASPPRALSPPPRLAGAAAAALALTIAACEGASPSPPTPAPPSTSERVLVAAGEFRAGLPDENPPVRNPLEQDPNAASQGRQLYGWFNCAGCHGAEGGGGIGPPLRDPQWIYGSDPASVFQTIAQGRPNGMPAFGGKIPDEHIWRIELFVRSLGGVETVVRAGGSSGQSPTQPVQPREGQ